MRTRVPTTQFISPVASSFVTASLDNGEESTSMSGIHEPCSDSLPVNGAASEEDHSGLDNSCDSSRPDLLPLVDDVTPIENARARFQQVLIDHFLRKHVVEVGQVEEEVEEEKEDDRVYDGARKRKQGEAQYEGDPRFALPLMYVANLYETLVSEVNARLMFLDGIREKTIGVALEAAGGLYRRLTKKFPREGACRFRRRELATSLETRSRFPELVREEKRVRFVVVNGLEIVEKPATFPSEDAEWFKRLTGRCQAAISERDYKFYSPRHKCRRAPSETVTDFPESQPHHQNLPSHHLTQHSSPHFPRTVEIPFQSASALSQHVTCFQPIPVSHVGSCMAMLAPTGPAKFCDECGVPFLRETSKFCSECGAKRLGI
ncbi:PPR containing protein isoform X2 [Wolffia australiana]